MKRFELDMNNLNIYRKRIIPDECILLKDDIILEISEAYIVTKWHTLKERQDFHHGYSCYYLNNGFKVSKFYRKDNSLLYWYCDIVDYVYKQGDNALIVCDLLADVIVYPDGQVKVLDLDELSIALDTKLCSQAVVSDALRKLDSLLSIIYKDKFDTLSKPIDKYSCQA